MSLAKLSLIYKSRKEFTCSKCREVIPVGSSTVRFSVGFRSRPQTRHNSPGCYPKPSERESSLVASVYAAQEDIDFSTAMSPEDIGSIMEEVYNACEEVAGEYEQHPMYDNNPDIQERSDMVRSAGDDLLNWENEVEDPPEEDDDETWGNEGSYEDALEIWLIDARQAAQDLVDNMELP